VAFSAIIFWLTNTYPIKRSLYYL